MPVKTAIFEVATGVYGLTVGGRTTASNVYCIQSGDRWALVDTAWRSSAETIRHFIESVCGPRTRPSAILLTHIHPDHAGSARQLATAWGVPVFVHPAELPLAAGRLLPQYANPLDTWVLGPMMRLLPARTRARMVEDAAISDAVEALDPTNCSVRLPDWECIATPGHTPGHVALYRRLDRVLISGDAILTVDLNSVGGFVRGTPTVSGPPRYSTWNWQAAAMSISALAALRPQILAPGHGRPLAIGPGDPLQALSDRLERARYKSLAAAPVAT